MSEVAELVVRIKADASSLERELKKASTSTNSAAQSMTTSMNGLASSFRSLLPALSTAAIVNFTRNALIAADRLNDLAMRTGIAASTLSALRTPLEQGGSSAEEFASSINRMNNAIGEASKGQSQALYDTFNRLGLSVAKLKSLSPEQQFYEIARALNNVKNQADFTNLGMDIFGRSFSTLAPLIRESNGKLDAFVEKQKKLGTGLSDAEQARIDKWGDAWVENLNNIQNAAIRALIYLDKIFDAPQRQLNPNFTDPMTGKFTGREDLFAQIDTFKRKVGATNYGEQFGPNFPSTTDARGSNPSATGKGGELESARKALANYNTELQRNSELSKLAERDQIALKAKNETLDLAQKAGIKNTTSLVEANVALALEAYDTKEALEKQSEATRKAKDATERFREEMENKLASGLTQAVFAAGNAGDAFRNMANQIAQSIFEQNIAKPFAREASSMFGGMFGGGDILGGLSGLLPSFDVGTPYVPNDQIAKIHKGEMIIPAKEAEQFRSGGMGGVTVVQNNNFASGVTRAEMTMILPQVARAAHDAVFKTIRNGGSAAKAAGVA